jgi:ATP-dependent Lon protease
MIVSLLSLAKEARVRPDVAMTGEITLRGRVLPVGGVKEKVLAAYRARIKTILLPKRNQKDLEDIPPVVRKRLRLYFCETVQDVVRIALPRLARVGAKARRAGARKEAKPAQPSVADAPSDKAAARNVRNTKAAR